MASQKAHRRAPESGRAAARAVAEAFGGQPNVRRYYDADETHSVDLLSCENIPTPGLISYSTVSLHAAPNKLDNSDLRIEMAGVAPTAATQFPNLLGTAALFVIKNGWLCAPGVVFPSLIRRYEPDLSASLDHVMWTPPFPWDQLGSVHLTEDLTAHWLLAMPISEAERRFLLDRGYDALESLFVEREVEYFNLARHSIV